MYAVLGSLSLAVGVLLCHAQTAEKSFLFTRAMLSVCARSLPRNGALAVLSGLLCLSNELCHTRANGSGKMPKYDCADSAVREQMIPKRSRRITFESILCLPPGSFPSSSIFYHRLKEGRRLLRDGVFSQQDDERLKPLMASPSYRTLMQYPGPLWPGEFDTCDDAGDPSPIEFDWPSLSTETKPGHETHKLEPWMDPPDPADANISPSYLLVTDREAMEEAAWCSAPDAFANASVDSLRPSAKEVSRAFESLEAQRKLGRSRYLHLPLYSPLTMRETKRPLNPICLTSTASTCNVSDTYGEARGDKGARAGPTGISGRGVLGKWGPNHAVDVILTTRNPTNGKLQVVLIRRTDGSNTYAFPGGFVDPSDGHQVVTAAVREFLEETMAYEESEDDGNDEDISASRQSDSLDILRMVFGPFRYDKGTKRLTWDTEEHIVKPQIVFCGYSDDERNTDNAWVETVAMHWHLPSGYYNKVHFRAGDDAAKNSAALYYIQEDPILTAEKVDLLHDMFASHSGFLRKVLLTSFPQDFERMTSLKEKKTP